MARNNYKSEKRRKEIDRQKKNEAKRLRRLAAREGNQPEQDDAEQIDDDQNVGEQGDETGSAETENSNL